jgi:site-specific DNA-methyltransferase (adenine-specific)
MKPLDGTFAQNAEKWGVAGLWIDGGRVSIDPSIDDPRLGGKGDWASDKMAKNVYEGGYAGNRVGSSEQGRWPANLVHDGSDEVLAGFPHQSSGGTPSHRFADKTRNAYGQFNGQENPNGIGSSSGSAARFFYCAKASRAERNAGLEGMEKIVSREWRTGNAPPNIKHRVPDKTSYNNHPTVKPLALMEYLCKLTRTPTGGLVFDPFAGSGTTGVACVNTSRDFIGVEKDPHYYEIAKKRINHAKGLYGKQTDTSKD